jgi:hypothetical protein
MPTTFFELFDRRRRVFRRLFFLPLFLLLVVDEVGWYFQWEAYRFIAMALILIFFAIYTYLTWFAFRCPHCDVSLATRRERRGFLPFPTGIRQCPNCGFDLDKPINPSRNT